MAELDEVQEAIARLVAEIESDTAGLTLDECDARGLSRPGTDADYCDMSFLRTTQCALACCLNHHIDDEILEASKL